MFSSAAPVDTASDITANTPQPTADDDPTSSQSWLTICFEVVRYLYSDWQHVNDVLIYTLMILISTWYLIQSNLRQTTIPPALYILDIPGHRLVYAAVHTMKRVRVTIKGSTLLFSQANYNELTGRTDETLLMPYFNCVVPDDEGVEEIAPENRAIRIVVELKKRLGEGPFLTLIVKISREFSANNFCGRFRPRNLPRILPSTCSLELDLDHEFGRMHYTVNCRKLMAERRDGQQEVYMSLLYPEFPE